MNQSELLAAVTAMYLDGLPVILSWVGVAVSAAVALVLVYMGIRAAFGFFFNLSEYTPAAAGSFVLNDDQATYFAAHDEWAKTALESGWSVDDAYSAAEVAGDLAVMQKRGEI